MPTSLASLVDLYCTLQEVNYTDVADVRAPPEYLTKLSAPLGFEYALPQVGAGVMAPSFADVQMSNVNGAIATEGSRYGTFIAGSDQGYGDYPYGGSGEITLSELLSVEDIRGKRARARILNLDTYETLATIDGVIASPKAGGAKASLRIEQRHTQAFQQLLPLQRIVDIYPDADLTGAADQDAPVIKPFGVMRKVRLIAVSEGIGAYDYGLLYKPATGTLTLNTVYRENKVVPTSDYSLVEAVAGYYVVRFTNDPRSSGQAVDIRVTVTSTEFARPSDAVKWVLHALGKSVNAGIFAGAAATYAAAGYGAPAHGLHERRSANDILNDLLLRGAAIELNPVGEYHISVDAAGAHLASSVTLGAGDSQWQNADPDSIEREVLSDMDQVGTLKLFGAYDIGFGGDSNYLITTTQTIPGGTVTREDPCPYIGDAATLDIEASYRAKRYQYSTAPLTLVADLEASELRVGQLVPLWIPNDVINGESYELSRLAYRASRGGTDDIDASFACTFRGYNAGIFTYAGGVVQTSPGALALTDYTFTIPLAPTSLTLVSQTLQGNTGNAFVVHSATAPAENVTHLVFRAIPTGSVIPLAGEAVIACLPGQTGVQGALTLTAGISYTIQCFAHNSTNAVGYRDGVITQILNFIPAGDTTVPPQVTGLVVTAGSYKSLNVSWDLVDQARLRNYEVYVAHNSGFTTIEKILTPQSRDISVTGLLNGFTYYVRVRAVYNNGVSGAYSATAAATTALVATADVGNGQITNALIAANAIDFVNVRANAIQEVNITASSISSIKIQGDAVTSDKRQLVATLTGAYSIPAGTSTTLLFTHSVGRTPLVTSSTGSSSILASFFNVNSAQIWVVLVNRIEPPGATIEGTLQVFFW